MELHPLCTLFPRVGGDEFRSLVDDIRANGLRHPIIVYDGMILDGGNRYRACAEAGIVPEYEEFTGADAVAYVMSTNLHRRHMTPGQSAAIVALAQDWAKAQPAYRPEKAGNVTGLSTVESRAKQSGASDKTQRNADKVAKAAPGLARQVAHGEVTLPKAVETVEGKAKKAKKIEKKAEEEIKDELDAAFADVDTVEEWKKTQKELEEAQLLIKSLTAQDQAAELKRQFDLRKVVEARLADEMTKSGRLQRDLDAYGKWYAELRKITGKEVKSEITRAIKEAMKSMQDTVTL